MEYEGKRGVGWERCWMGTFLDGSVVAMLMAWWSGGETMVEWWFDGGLIKIKKENAI